MKVIHKLVSGVLLAICTVSSAFAAGESTEIPGRKYVKVGEYNIAYREWGDESGKPVMLIHGIPLNTVLWSKVGPLLAEQGYHVFAPGQLGLSYTTGPIDSDHSLRGQAKIMADFAKQVIRKPFILYGHDTGGGVAQIMVTEPNISPQIEVTKIVIGNAAVLDMWPVPEANQAIAAAKRDDAAEVFSEEAVREMVKTFASNGLMHPDITLTNEVQSDLFGNYAVNPQTRSHFIQYLRSMDNKWTVDASPKMVMWNKPALLLWAIHDPFQPPYVSGVALAKIMPHAKWEYIDASHFYPLEKPEEVASKFISWEKNY